ncbi:hypothetical protein TREMEDRAFT_70638 [Tremella mesenterica DSM 1558]|uniref:uncharacterized protein n=1 Tax=Tremella mesenterica (strain ATCC 24925 / CBS 8224 / DSM 1558 / NBRC 9311 / NRRL Y-6157 / RJB 2259-6 / UBC 559-6) TaxID=578456 RepID=UPI0003F4A638|nr:uncharacterized protein TREMEDRAFT_70638 [Tremella mesenterica DSM 1558]EIW72163.1 hypothetical protein TREMEDRAFT_70638 [Tremella mesenterica DSM 1558]
MDVIRPGHAHRSSSDRLLNNYLDSQKGLATALLTLLSHSHSSTSSLLAYVTSSPGVIPPIRRAVRHAAFEGPLSASLLENAAYHEHSTSPDTGTPGWAAYVSSLEQFRKDLKQIHLLEEELSRVKRDREILVTRLIKTTKTKPTRNDLSAMANSYSQSGYGRENMSSRASVLSVSSGGSVVTKEGKRAGKLAEAQAELLGCEEHLRGLEVRIEAERNKVMLRGLEERFKAMEVVGQMWVGQAKRGLDELVRVHGASETAYENDSANGSIAPYESASQSGYEDHSGHHLHKSGHLNGAGSITGSIAEEDEDGSSTDEGHGRALVVHENRPGGRSPVRANTASRAHRPNRPSPLGVPSVVAPRPQSSAAYNNPRSGGRRVASDVGASSYHPPASRQSLRRTFSHEDRRAGSDTSSVRQGSTGGKKKRGFFASLSRFFKGPKKPEGSRTGRDSPAYGASSTKWHTRTESNIKRVSTFGRSAADSSSDDEGGNLVSVNNNRDNTWSVDQVGRVPSKAHKRSSTLPVASGLIPPKPTKSDLGANRVGGSQSTLTMKNTASKRATSPLPVGAKATGAAAPTSGTLGRSGTVKSTQSATSTGTVKKTRQNGTAQGRNIMSMIETKDAAPVMPEVPKAPRSQITPQMELVKAPGTSIIPASASAPVLKSAPMSKPTVPLPKTVAPATNGDLPRPLSRINSVKKVSQPPTATSTARSSTPLPPSRTLAPPLKSAMRPTSPSPPTEAPLTLPPPNLFTITAPGPVQLPVEEKPIPKQIRPASPVKRLSYQSTNTEGGSVYESANDFFDAEDGADSSSSEDELEGYQVVENSLNAKAGEVAGSPKVERIHSEAHGVEEVHSDYASDDTDTGKTLVPSAQILPQQQSPQPAQNSTLESIPSKEMTESPGAVRRKSVRMAVPDSPAEPHPPTGSPLKLPATLMDEERAPSPEPERPTGQWSSRISTGVREDESEESDQDETYKKAKKGLVKNTGRWEAVQMAKEAGERLKAKRSGAGGAGSARSSSRRSVR